jgi:hypothetical protein
LTEEEPIGLFLTFPLYYLELGYDTRAPLAILGQEMTQRMDALQKNDETKDRR